MDAEFFERLYRGYLGEHLISGELFARSFEVFRLPADFGFDLVVTNQFRTSQGLTADSGSFPFSIQVKSRWVRPEDFTVGPNNRPEVQFAYWLKQEEVDLLARHPNSAVAFVFYLSPQGRAQSSHFFVIRASDVVGMINNGFLRPIHGKYELAVRFRDVPRESRDRFVDELLSAQQITNAGADRLRAVLTESFRLNWNAKPYFQLARNPRAADHKELVWKSAELCTDFQAFPNIPEITIQD